MTQAAAERPKFDGLSEQFARRQAERRQLREGEQVAPVMAEMTLRPDPELMRADPDGLPDGAALAALLRNSLAGEAAPGQPTLTVKLAAVGQSLERDGCDYLNVALLCLKRSSCPEESRMFVLAICALSGGDGESLHVIPDVKIAELLGYEKHAIGPMRQALIRWQRETNYAFIDIIEGDYDRTLKKYVSTQYRPRIVTFLADVLRDSRAKNMRSAHAAQRIATDEQIGGLIDERKNSLPTGSVHVPRESKRGAQKAGGKTGAERQIDMTYARFDRWVGDGADLLATFLMNGTDPWTIRDEMVARLDQRLRVMTEHYPQYQRE